jgi:hypothetical protein
MASSPSGTSAQALKANPRSTPATTLPAVRPSVGATHPSRSSRGVANKNETAITATVI